MIERETKDLILLSERREMKDVNIKMSIMATMTLLNLIILLPITNNKFLFKIYFILNVSLINILHLVLNL